ncbi:hypothetical protein [Streptomyces sp. NPDC001270]|uniref:hypothetical protein n=1 Tax=Streptomyces sp. NPDC001270 TaxID=3364554 RepID=UPI0036C44E89
MLGLYIGLTVIITGLAITQPTEPVLHVGATLAALGAVAVPATGYLFFRAALSDQRVRIERDLYPLVRNHLLHDSQFTAPTAPTVVDMQARRTAGKDTPT